MQAAVVLLARRLLFAVPAAWAAVTFAFLMLHFAPGGPAAALGGEHGAAGYLEDVTRVYGLDRPVHEIYLDWLGRVVRGDLGYSYRSQAKVIDLIAERVPVTLALMLPTLVLASAIGLGLGLWCAELPRRRGLWVTSTLIGLNAIPSYVLAQLLVLVFALELGWLPVQGLMDARASGDRDAARALQIARHLVLPVLSLTVAQLAYMALLTHERVRDELVSAYIVTARAKGLAENVVLRRHALPNAAPPIVALIGTRFASLVGGAVIIETVYALPGLGRLAVTAALARDHPTVLGIVLAAFVVILAVHFIADLILVALDPRLRQRQ